MDHQPPLVPNEKAILFFREHNLTILSELRYNLDFFIAGLKNLGLTHVVISPGSRNAPIVAGFLRVGGFNLLSAPDERAAAFMALGSAQATGKACAVVCTSGTAVLNLYPAICEAYYHQIPLLAITADRPEMMIDRWDGQTIRQKDIFEKHIVGSYHFNTDLHLKSAEEEARQVAIQAWENAHKGTQGPVHINIPLSEPIYSGIDSKPFHFENLPESTDIAQNQSFQIPEDILQSHKVLILAGQSLPNYELQQALNSLGTKLPVLADILSNVHGENTFSGTEKRALYNGISAPEILITTGMSAVSKALKEWLRNNKPNRHYHISAGTFVADPFFTQPVHIQCNPAIFFKELNELALNREFDKYKAEWQQFETETEEETQLVFDILNEMHENDAVHLGNSMTVRQANSCINVKGHFYGNRGTSGIDGSISTACGYAWSHAEQRVVCISGDIGFLYDKNAFWCNPMPENLKVIVINNGRGRIFDKIEGPGKLESLRPYIQTPHNLSAEYIAKHFGIAWRSFNLKGSNKGVIGQFLKEPGSGILEIFSTD